MVLGGVQALLRQRVLLRGGTLLRVGKIALESRRGQGGNADGGKDDGGDEIAQ